METLLFKHETNCVCTNKSFSLCYGVEHTSRRDWFLKLGLKKSPVWLLEENTAYSKAKYTFLHDNIPAALSVVNIESFVVQWDSNTQFWYWSVGMERSDKEERWSWTQCEWALLEFCAGTGLSIKKKFFQHRDIHKYVWIRDTLWVCGHFKNTSHSYRLPFGKA